MEEVKKSKSGIGHIKKTLQETGKTETNAFFWQIPHNSGEYEISLKFGRYKKSTFIPWKQDSISEVTLNEGELSGLIEFISENYRPIKAGETKYLPVTDIAIRKYIEENPDVLTNLVKDKLTQNDVIAVAYRKKQIGYFESLIDKNDFFEKYKNHYDIKGVNEAVWQFFFEKNQWIFGYGLNYIFNSPLEGKKLEQVILGFNFNEKGKRVDALLKSRGLINSICIVEIKTLIVSLMKEEKYRNVYVPSEELIGGVQQLRSYLQKTVQNVAPRIDIKNEDGSPTGESVYTYLPKAVLVIGFLKEFIGEFGVNEDRHFAFEAFRKNNIDVEVMTFDELFERAKYIADNK